MVADHYDTFSRPFSLQSVRQLTDAVPNPFLFSQTHYVLSEYGVSLRADRVGKSPAIYPVAAASTMGHSTDGSRPGWGCCLVSGVGLVLYSSQLPLVLKLMGFVK